MMRKEERDPLTNFANMEVALRVIEVSSTFARRQASVAPHDPPSGMVFGGANLNAVDSRDGWKSNIKGLRRNAVRT